MNKLRLYFTLILTLTFLFGCELHEQNSILGEKPAAKNNQLKTLDALLAGILQDNIEKVSEILNGDTVELNVPNKQGKLLLNEAVKLERVLIGKFLIEKGVDPKTKTETGESAISLMEASENKTVWMSIVEDGLITPSYMEKDFFETLATTPVDSQAMAVSRLREHTRNGVNLDARDDSKFTFLMIASSRDLVEIVNFLCTFSGTDPNVVVERGRGRRKQTFTALTFATSEQMKATLKACGATE